jgi:peptide/nickel transport system permease protein
MPAMNGMFTLYSFYRRHKILAIVLVMFLFVALLAPLLASHLPLYAYYKGQHCFPAFNPDGYVMMEGKKVFYQTINWKETDLPVIMAPVAWSPQMMDYANADYVSPFARQVYYPDGVERPLPFLWRHHLGTDKLGRDVLAGLIHGLRSSLFTGLLAMLLAGFIALVAGSLSGYFGNEKLKMSRAALIAMLLAMPALWFYAVELQRFSTHDCRLLKLSGTVLIMALTLAIFRLLAAGLSSVGFFRHKISIPADRILTRLTELITAMPRLILILTLGALFKPSLLSLAFIIGLTSWPEMARLLRSSIISLLHTGYVESARALGFSDLRIILHHLLPNAIGPMLVALTFGISATILVESSLTFLGIGLPPETVSWGSLLARARENFSAWWLALFPGLAIFCTVLLMNMTADAIQRFHKPHP